MEKKYPDFRLHPEKRIVPKFDENSIKIEDIPSEKMGFRVVDNCAEENQR